MKNDQEVKTQFDELKPWGMCTSVDVSGCDPAIIRDGEKIKQFVIELCDLIGMKRYGDATVVDFGQDPRITGFSMTQLIETSLVSGHFANQSNTAYIDIFSCQYYPPYRASEFAKEFFKGQSVVININFRG